MCERIKYCYIGHQKLALQRLFSIKANWSDWFVRMPVKRRKIHLYLFARLLARPSKLKWGIRSLNLISSLSLVIAENFKRTATTTVTASNWNSQVNRSDHYSEGLKRWAMHSQNAAIMDDRCDSLSSGLTLKTLRQSPKQPLYVMGPSSCLQTSRLRSYKSSVSENEELRSDAALGKHNNRINYKCDRRPR